jgi:hypothetical protein
MKRAILSGVLALLAAVRTIAAPATPGTLTDYIALGSSGATIGSTLFSNFTLLSLQTGATQIPASNVSVTPLNTPGNPGLIFTLNQIASAGEFLELRLSYDVIDTAITGAAVSIEGATTTNDGAVTSQIIPGGTSLDPPALIAFSTLGISEPSANGSFSPVALVTMESDIVVDGGLEGEASLLSTTNSFVVPEPSSFFYEAVIIMVWLSRRHRRHSSKPTAH